MKKTLSLLAFCLFSNVLNSYADTVTGGSVGLLIISTTTEDGRNWGDKVNSNFEIIAATIGANINRLNNIGPGSVVIYDDGVKKGTVNTIDFGSNLTATVSGATGTVSASGGGGGGADSSTTSFTMYGGGAFLSTANPIGTTTHRVTKSTWQVLGVDAFINKTSSVGATIFKVWITTSDNYGIAWSTITPQIVVSTNNRSSVFISTGFQVQDGNWIGVGIDTIPISGLQPEDWGVKLHYWKRQSGQTY